MPRVRKIKKLVHRVRMLVPTKKRADGLLPPHVRDIMKEVGDKPITSVVVVRTPIESFVKRVMQLFSAGTYEQAVKDSNNDSVFHLGLELNRCYTLDKQAVITMVKGTPYSLKPNSQRVEAMITHPVTFNELLQKTKVAMGPAAFSGYNAQTNNCQDFVLQILSANGMLTESLRSFIKQDANAVFAKMPSFTQKIAKAATDVAAVVDRVIEGEGEPKVASWKDYYAARTRGQKFKSRDEINAHMKKVAAEYRAEKGK